VIKSEKYQRKMSSESILTVSSILASIENDFEIDRTLKEEAVKKFFDELMKFENGQAAVKEFSWLFGIGENASHTVANNEGEKKECRKVFLVDFKQCRKVLSKFTSQD
jgi:hypothetical protein